MPTLAYLLATALIALSSTRSVLALLYTATPTNTFNVYPTSDSQLLFMGEGEQVEETLPTFLSSPMEYLDLAQAITLQIWHHNCTTMEQSYTGFKAQYSNPDHSVDGLKYPICVGGQRQSYACYAMDIKLFDVLPAVMKCVDNFTLTTETRTNSGCCSIYWQGRYVASRLRLATHDRPFDEMHCDEREPPNRSVQLPMPTCWQ